MFKCAAVVALFLAVSGGRAIAEPAGMLLRAGLPAFPPFYFERAVSGCEGVAAVELQAVAAAAGISVEVQPLPYARMLNALEAGQIDIALIFRNQQADQIALPLATAGDSRVLVASDRPRSVTRWTDLYAFQHIGVIRGADYGERFDADERLRKWEVETYDQAARMLLAQRLDAVAGSAEGLGYVFASAGRSINDLPVQFEVGRQEWILYLSKRHRLSPEQVDALKAIAGERWAGRNAITEAFAQLVIEGCGHVWQQDAGSSLSRRTAARPLVR